MNHITIIFLVPKMNAPKVKISITEVQSCQIMRLIDPTYEVANSKNGIDKKVLKCFACDLNSMTMFLFLLMEVGGVTCYNFKLGKNLVSPC